MHSDMTAFKWLVGTSSRHFVRLNSSVFSTYLSNIFCNGSADFYTTESNNNVTSKYIQSHYHTRFHLHVHVQYMERVITCKMCILEPLK